VVRSFRRGACAAVFALSLAPLLAACAAGNDAATLKIRADSASATVGVIKVLNAYVLTDTDGPAAVTARLFNNGSTDQTLQSVKLGNSTTALLAGADGAKNITVPAHGSVLLGGKGNPTATVDTSTESFQDGDVQNAVFTFSTTGAVPIQINVTPATGFFESYGPSSLPTSASPSPSASASPSASTTPSSTATPTGTATPTDTGTATPTGTATATQ
jgi:hypothetical protein